MKVTERITETREEIARWKRSAEQAGKEALVGFVPTMGYLHEGHLSLIREARKRCGFVVLSIFVNPLQFGPNEDFDRYPRNGERDLQLARENGVDLVFMPGVADMYPEPPKTTVAVSDEMSSRLCGVARPGHFDGVATVVLKLFQIVQPDKAFFGLKDAQQYAIIHRMCADFNLPVEVVGCPIVREPDGLAMSSRNVYLNGEERRQAAVLRKALKQAERLATDHPDRTVGELAAKMREIIGSAPLAEPEYVEAVLFPSLSEIPGDRSVRQLGGETVLFALAVRFGSTRLIDNTILEL